MFKKNYFKQSQRNWILFISKIKQNLRLSAVKLSVELQESMRIKILSYNVRGVIKAQEPGICLGKF